MQEFLVTTRTSVVVIYFLQLFGNLDIFLSKSYGFIPCFLLFLNHTKQSPVA